MKKLARPASFLLLLALGSAFAVPREEYPSEASRVFATHVPAAVGTPPAKARVAAALAFLDGLDVQARRAGQLELGDSERRRWTNVPPSASDAGARLGDLDEKQLRLLADLLARALSPQGYAKVRDIMLADDRLLRNGQPRVGFGVEEYRVVVFGEPSQEQPWALQLDGHHIGLNLTFHGERATMSPSFIGTQPAAYTRDGAEIVPLRGEADAAFALIHSLAPAELELALVDERRGQIVSGPGRDGVVPEAHGLRCARLDAEQRVLLLRLLGHYVGDLPEAAARERLAALEREIDAMVFAWSGPITNPSDVSYRLLGPKMFDKVHEMR